MRVTLIRAALPRFRARSISRPVIEVPRSRRCTRTRCLTMDTRGPRKFRKLPSEELSFGCERERPFILEFRNSGRRRIYSIAETRTALPACTRHDNARFVAPVKPLNLQRPSAVRVGRRFIRTRREESGVIIVQRT